MRTTKFINQISKLGMFFAAASLTFTLSLTSCTEDDNETSGSVSTEETVEANFTKVFKEKVRRVNNELADIVNDDNLATVTTYADRFLELTMLNTKFQTWLNNSTQTHKLSTVYSVDDTDAIKAVGGDYAVLMAKQLKAAGYKTFSLFNMKGARLTYNTSTDYWDYSYNADGLEIIYPESDGTTTTVTFTATSDDMKPLIYLASIEMVNPSKTGNLTIPVVSSKYNVAVKRDSKTVITGTVEHDTPLEADIRLQAYDYDIDFELDATDNSFNSIANEFTLKKGNKVIYTTEGTLNIQNSDGEFENAYEADLLGIIQVKGTASKELSLITQIQNTYESNDSLFIARVADRWNELNDLYLYFDGEDEAQGKVIWFAGTVAADTYQLLPGLQLSGSSEPYSIAHNVTLGDISQLLKASKNLNMTNISKLMQLLIWQRDYEEE